MLDRTGQSGSDAAVYPELARANLKRMRGEYDEARSICLSILKRYPGNLTAHTLLGDIHAEAGELTQAAEWYEMALEIAPDSAADRAKLEQVKERLAEREMATTAKQLGLPTPQPRAKWFAWSTVAFVAIVGLGGFLLGDFFHSKRTAPSVVRTPITVQGSVPGESVTVAIPTPSAPREETPRTPPPSAAARPSQDSEVLDLIRSKCVDGERVTDASKDPRSSALHVTFGVGGQDDVRSTAARLAVSILDCFQESPMVTVRCVRNGNVVYVADARRNDLTEVRRMLPPNTPESDADLTGALTNEWAAESQPTAPAGPDGSR